MKILLSIGMIVIMLMTLYFLSKRYNLTKEQKFIFGILVMFWLSLSVIRSYRKVYAISPIDEGGLGLSAMYAAQVASGYGLMSFFARFPLFIVSETVKKRKVFIQLALVIFATTSIILFFEKSFTILYISALAMGLCATMLAMFNVIFSETFSKEKAAISVSILSIAPLMAEFCAAPIQYMFTYGHYKHYDYMWLFSATVAIITFLLTLKMKDYVPKETTSLSFNKMKKILTHKSFIGICMLAFLVSFTKFSTSGANMIAYAKIHLGMKPIMLAYLDMIFALPQLVGGILVGIYFKPKWGIRKTLSVASLIACSFFILTMIFTNPYIFFFSYVLNGFSYGLMYNLLIGLALQYFDKEYRNLSMGIFQTFFAAGIFLGDYIYVFITQFITSSFLTVSKAKVVFLMAMCLSFICLTVAQFLKEDTEVSER